VANIPKVWNGTAFIELEAAATVAPAASTTVVGIVQLTDSTSSTSTTTAATPNSVKSAYDLAGTAIPKNTVTAAGDILYASGSATVARLAIGTASQVLSVVAGIPSWATIAAAGADVQEFTSSGSWVKPAGKSAVYVFAVGAGGGGASGRRVATAIDSQGGAGGGGGAHVSSWMTASSLPGTVTITIGNGGAGGSVATGTGSADGVDGAAGGNTSFGTIAIGIGGLGGQWTDTASLVQSSRGAVEWGKRGVSLSSAGGTAGRTGDAPSSGSYFSEGDAASYSEFMYPGRGAQFNYGAQRAANRTAGGGAGGRGFGFDGTVAAGGTANGGTGDTAATIGCGGGGGGANQNGNGGNGGAGFLGGGGGGGGAVYRTSGSHSPGTGGAGGGGYILVISV